MYSKWLTKFDNPTDFMTTKWLRRDEASKFFVQYAKEVMWFVSDTTERSCNFTDLNKARPDLKETIQESCQLWLFQWHAWKFMPTELLTNAQAITVLMRMIDGKKDETQWHFAQVYFDTAKEYEIMNWLNLNSTANFDKLTTRGEVAKLLFNGSNLAGIKLNNKDYAYIDNQIETTNKKFKLDSKERQDYINSLYDIRKQQWDKDKLITSNIIENLEEKTTTIYVDWLKCTIINIDSMIWGWWMDANKQIIGINVNCKNISKNKITPILWYWIHDLSLQSSNTFYTNNNGQENEEGYQPSSFFTDGNIKSPIFDQNTVVNPWASVSWRMLSEVPNNITRIRYWLSNWDDFWAKRVVLKQTLLKSKEEKIAEIDKECLNSFSSTDCLAIKHWLIIDWISEAIFNSINNSLKEEWKPYYKISIRDSYLWEYYCQENYSSETCVRISNWVVDGKTTIFY